LPNGVAEGRAQHSALVLHLLVLGFDEHEVRVDVGTEVEHAHGLDVLGRLALPRAIKREDPREGLASNRIFGRDGGLPDRPSGVTPAPDLGAPARGGIVIKAPEVRVRWPEDEVVDALGVGLDVAGEPAKHLADRGGGLPGGILEEHVVAIGDLDEEVPTSAALALQAPTRLVPVGLVAKRLDQHAGGVGEDAECVEHRVGVHRVNDGGAHGGAGVLEPPRHRPAIDGETEPPESILLAVKRQAITPLVARDVRDQRRCRERALKQHRWHRGGDDLRHGDLRHWDRGRVSDRRRCRFCDGTSWHLRHGLDRRKIVGRAIAIGDGAGDRWALRLVRDGTCWHVDHGLDRRKIVGRAIAIGDGAGDR